MNKHDNEQITEIIREVYANAATQGCCLCATNAYDETELAHIPDEVKNCNQGCSSPLSDAVCEIAAGNTVIDLGCGAGLDVFIAAKYVGASGRAVGIDMTPEMLDIAVRNAPLIAEKLGFANTAFFEARIETLPIGDEEADVVISNCVVNLSQEKEKVFSEIFRVLKPDGRFVISDVYAKQPIPEHMKNDPKLVGMCLGGAMELDEFHNICANAGFRSVATKHEDAYTEIDGYGFLSVTHIGYKNVSPNGACCAACDPETVSAPDSETK